MKKNIKKAVSLQRFSMMILLLFVSAGTLVAQDSTVVAQPVLKPEVRLAKNTFESIWMIDNQTVMVPKKKTLEFIIQHRFGIVNNGYKDFYGLFAPSNIRLGLNFVPINKLSVGIGLTKEKMQVDLNAKYAIFKQTENNRMPVSVTFYGNAAIDTRDKSNFRYTEHRYSYFSQLMVARKVTSRFSAQVSGSFSWYNNIEGYVDSKGQIQKKMKNGHLAIEVMGRYKFSEKSSFIINYDQPLTQHPTNNPHPNISFGLETTTDSHAFQVFAGNYHGIVQQTNNFFNQNDYTKGQFCIGFNMTRLWAF